MKKMGHSVRTPPLNRASRPRVAQSKAHKFLNTVQMAGRVRRLEVKDFCDSYGVNQDTFTRLTGFSPRAVAHWAQGRRPSASTERRLSELGRLFAELEKLIAGEKIGPCLKEPNPAFDGSPPFQLVHPRQ